MASSSAPFRVREPARGTGCRTVSSPPRRRYARRRRARTQPTHSIGRIVDASGDEGRAPAVESGISVAPARRRIDVQALLGRALGLDGAFAAAVIDVARGRALGSRSRHQAFDIEAAARAHAKLIAVNRRMMAVNAVGAALEDVLIACPDQLHIVRPLGDHDGALFLLVALDRAQSCLGLARHQLAALTSAAMHDAATAASAMGVTATAALAGHARSA